MTTTTRVTERNAEIVLALVADWMGDHGMSKPVPTGSAAAYSGLGPMLIMDWDWPCTPTPTVILEGGPYDWAADCCADVQASIDAAGMSLFVEPYSAWALCIYHA